MSSAFRKALLVLVAFVMMGCQNALNVAEQPTAPATEPSQPLVLRITADPNNLPFTNDKLEGFENKLAELVAKDLGATIEYSWRAQRRGFFRETLKEDKCDLVLGVPKGFDRALTTIPYYRSTYAFVSRADRKLDINSFDDPRLEKLRIGVQVIGDDGANTPPAHSLAARGLAANLVGFTVYGDYTEANPPARIVEAVAKGDIDIAVVWGPLAGYFAKKQSVPLNVVPVSPDADGPFPMTFAIAMGVRKKDKDLRDRIDMVLHQRKAEVDQILAEYNVPRVQRKSGEANPTQASRNGGDGDDERAREVIQCCR